MFSMHDTGMVCGFLNFIFTRTQTVLVCPCFALMYVCVCLEDVPLVCVSQVTGFTCCMDATR